MFSTGNIMGMLGGSMVIKSGDVIINRLKAAKVMEPGDMGSVMSKAMSLGQIGQLSKLFQNPQSKGGSKASSNASLATEKLPTFGIGQMTKAAIIDDFNPALETFLSKSAELVGLGSDPTGLVVTAATANILDSLSRADPALSTEKLLGPALRDDALDVAANVVEQVTNEVLARTLQDYWGAHLVQEQAAILLLIVSDSDWARDQAEAMAAFQASVSIAGALLLSGSGSWKSVMERTFQPDSLEDVKVSNEEWATINDGDRTITV